ncbi:hypothetical protein D3C78_1188820 [compost metagenome]
MVARNTKHNRVNSGMTTSDAGRVFSTATTVAGMPLELSTSRRAAPSFSSRWTA